MTNSLQASISARDVIDQIRLSLNSDIGKDLVYILIEGINDRKVYAKLFDHKKTNIEYANGKEQVLAALNELNSVTKQIIGICDADFCHLRNIVPPIHNLFFTDYHDIEMTMLSVDGVLHDALTLYDLQDNSSLILQNILDVIQVIGYLRYLNQTDDIELFFEGLRLTSFSSLQDNSIQFDVNNYLIKLNTRSKNKKRDITLDGIMDFKQRYYTDDLFNLCNGHDVTSLITFIIDNKVSDNVSHKVFCAVLIASFNVHYFQETKLYKNILTWQINHGFSMLRT